MKHLRPLAIILAALLLFTLVSCGNTADPVPPTQAPSAAPANNGGSTGADDGAFHISELPDIGDYVSGEKCGYFFEDGPHSTFEPRSDYGRVIPYIAHAGVYTMPEYYSYTDYDTGETVTGKNSYRESLTISEYGLMTEDGKIITDGGWEHAYYYKFSDGTGYIRLVQSRPQDGKETYLQPVDYIGLDGSWKVSTLQDYEFYINMPADVPYFCTESDGNLQVYDTSGRCRFIFENWSTNNYKNITDFSILYADRDLVTISNHFYENNTDTRREIVTTLTWNGELLHRFEPAGSVLNFGGEMLFVRLNENSLMPVGKDGNYLGSTAYTAVDYSETYQTYLAVTQENGAYRAKYFDAQWNPVQKESNWPQSILSSFQSYSLIENGSTAVVKKWNETAARDFYGNPVRFPATETETEDMSTVIDYDNDNACIILEKTNGWNLLCALDGSLLTEFPPEKNDRPQGSEATLYSTLINGDFIYITADHELHVFTVETGEEQTIHLDIADENEKKSDTFNEQNVYVFDAGKDLIPVQSHLWNKESYETSEENNAVYSRGGRIRTVRNVISVDFFSGFCTIAAESGYYVYTAESELLLKLQNKDII